MNMPEPQTSQTPPPAPVAYAGQWVAWNSERNQIIAHGLEFGSVHRAAVQAGHADPVMEHVRNPKAAFIGAA